LLITAANKMRAGTRVRAGFSGTISETVSFEPAQAQGNFAAFDAFIKALPPSSGTGRHQWDAVEGSEIVALLRQIQTSRDSWKANAQALADYVHNRVGAGLLRNWTVVLAGQGRSKVPGKLGPYDIQLTEREYDRAPDGRVSISRLVSPADEVADLDSAAQRRAMDQTLEAWKKKPEPKKDPPKAASGPFVRKQRSRDRGLLLIYPIDAGLADNLPLIGFAISFPFDDDAPLIDYAENSVKQLERIFE
jgi:hypothetical protein